MKTYEQWVEALGLPTHKGYYIEDLRTVETGWWAERGCNTAFIQIVGYEGKIEIKVIGIPPGKTTQPWNFALDELFYVLEGRGLTTVWRAGQSARNTFEWQEHSLFMIPRQSFYQLSNARGDKPAKLLSYNFFPIALRIVEDPEFFFNNPYVSPQQGRLEDFYAEAKAQAGGEGSEEEGQAGVNTWYGNFFPDLGAWEKLKPYRRRGGGGHRVGIYFPNSAHGVHMSVIPVQRYKKAHRHGPILIVIPSGEGYSLLWEEGKEKIFIPWHEASCFIAHFNHQHFNVGTIPARYLAISPPRSWWDTAVYPQRQIEYPDEDPWIRQTYEAELAKRGLASTMPEEAYKNRKYQFKYAEDKD